DPRALQALDPGHRQRPPLNAHRQKKRMTGNLKPLRQFQEAIRTLRPKDDVFLRSENFHSKSPGLGHGAAGEIGAAEPGRKTEVVLDARAEPGLTAGRFAFDHHRVQAFAGAIDGGSETGGAASDNGEVVEAGLRVRAET